MGTPLELVKYNAASGKFEVGQAAVQALREVRAPVAVAAVCGRARQGKSFILNQLLAEGSNAGFTVGPTHRPCTKVSCCRPWILVHRVLHMARMQLAISRCRCAPVLSKPGHGCSVLRCSAPRRMLVGYPASSTRFTPILYVIYSMMS